MAMPNIMGIHYENKCLMSLIKEQIFIFKQKAMFAKHRDIALRTEKHS